MVVKMGLGVMVKVMLEAFVKVEVVKVDAVVVLAKVVEEMAMAVVLA